MNLNTTSYLLLKEFSKGILCTILLPKVTSSAYSNSSPTEIPLAIVEVIIAHSLICL
jgi:hypothetical protein